MLSKMSRIDKIISSIVLTVFAVIVVCGFAVYRYFFWPLSTISRSYVSNFQGGIELSEYGNRTYYRIVDMNGKTFDGREPFALTDTAFAYWSSVDEAVALQLDSWNQKRWYQFPKAMKEYLYMFSPDRLSTDGRFITVDMCRSTGNDVLTWKVLLLDISDGHWKAIPSAERARLDPSGSGQILLEMKGGKFVLQDLVHKGQDIEFKGYKSEDSFDFDFVKKKLYCMDGKGVAVVSSEGKRQFISIPTFLISFNLFFQPRNREVWATGVGLGDFTKDPIFSRDGHFLGILDSGSWYVLEAGKNTKRLLSKCLQETKEK